MLRAVAIVLSVAAFAGPAMAQDASSPLRGGGLPLSTGEPVGGTRTPIVTVERERLFDESAYGQRLADEIEAAGQALSEENRRIDAELIAEEQRLTEARETMDPAQFRAEADAFNDRVTRLREEQDSKIADLNARTERARRRFDAAIQPVLAEIMAETGALVMMDRRSVYVSSDRVDVTNAAIERLDASIGDGSDLETDAPAPPQPAESETGPDLSVPPVGD